jgi:hypothetical protein
MRKPGYQAPQAACRLATSCAAPEELQISTDQKIWDAGRRVICLLGHARHPPGGNHALS